MEENRENNIVKINILGAPFTLKTDADEEYVKKIADYIDKHLNDIVSKSPDIPTYKSAVLCLITVVDELLKTKKQLSEIEKDYGSKAAELINKIDESLSAEYSIE